jgi:hypothetical protein
MKIEIKTALSNLVNEFGKNRRISWNSVARSMQSTEGINLKPDQWRSAYRSMTGLSHKARAEKRRNAKMVSEISTSQNMVDNSVHSVHIDNGAHLADEKSVKVKIEVVQNDILKAEKQELLKQLYTSENKHTENWNGEQIIRFGVVSDCHLCSKYQQLTFLNHLYDIFQSEGISTVYNPGDITEGYKMRLGHEFEIFKFGADEQADYVIDVYPKRTGIVTKYITGNHDHSHIKNGGTDIGKIISNKRDDMVYLGMANAKVYITENCIVELNHPLDGASYALSYAPQKTIDAMSGGTKPNILLNGHHHKIFYMLYRNIHAYECGTTQAQTPWMLGKRLAANVGGLIIEVHVDKEGTITRCKGEYIPQYIALKNDY